VILPGDHSGDIVHVCKPTALGTAYRSVAKGFGHSYGLIELFAFPNARQKVMPGLMPHLCEIWVADTWTV
jgi:hypothetical protein